MQAPRNDANFATLPLLIEAGADAGMGGDGLAAWVEQNREQLESALRRHGAILFRGFGVDSPAGFRRFARSYAGELGSYVDGNSPRRKLASGVYTSTEYPAQYFISLHNELSYSHRWPAVLLFCCITAAAEGGETVIADSRALLSALSPEVVEEFRRKGVTYVRNLHGGNGFGPSWQETFETEDPAEAEAYCREGEGEWGWLEDGTLRISHRRAATAVHPQTGEEVWFNQADQFHPSTHPPEVYESLISLYAGREESLPQNVRFGDGTPIDPAVLDHIRSATLSQSVYFPWREGDVLMVDNMLVAHGRAPFSGDRKILVSMAGSCQ